MSAPATVPYGPDGHMLSFAFRDSAMRPNEPFTAELHVTAYQRGQSSARFLLERTSTGQTYPMFLTDVLALIKSTTLVQGKVSGTWQAVKRGQNYGLRLVAA